MGSVSRETTIAPSAAAPPRPPRAPRVVWLIFTRTIARTLLAPRNLLFALVFYSFPAVLGLLLGALAEPRARVATVVAFYSAIFPTVYLALPALLFGASAIPREIEEKTITFLFLRPIPKWTIVLGKYLATVAVLCLLTAASFGAFVATAGLRGGSAKDLGGTEALIARWESYRHEFERENRKLRRERDDVRSERRRVEREIEEARGRGAGTPVPEELRARRAELERREQELGRERHDLRRQGGDIAWLEERWQAGPDHADHAPLAIAILWLGLAAYTALFLFLGTAIRHYFIAGIIYAVLYQLVVMPLFKHSRIKWTVLNYHVQTLMNNEVLAAPGRMVDTYLGHTSTDALAILAGLTVIFVAGACLIFSRKEYVLKQ